MLGGNGNNQRAKKHKLEVTEGGCNLGVLSDVLKIVHIRARVRVAI